jgi:hypothetical protein
MFFAVHDHWDESIKSFALTGKADVSLLTQEHYSLNYTFGVRIF